MRSVEETLMQASDAMLSRAAKEVLPRADLQAGRLTVLEAVASLLGGWDLAEYWREALHSVPPVVVHPIPWATKIVEEISDLPIPAPLALAALSREVVTPSVRRNTGAYHTDWRLAEMLAERSVPRVTGSGPWIDPACGSGMLLAAAAMRVPRGPSRDKLIADKLIGADLSAQALRGTRLTVASLTDNLPAVMTFAQRLLLQDSLRSPQVWERIAPNGAALVIGNPPWEKLKISRHELARSQGANRHYGQDHAHECDVSDARRNLLAYLESVAAGTRLQGKGEHDLYKLFLELALGLAAMEGTLAMLAPAGLIRSKGTESLRREINDAAHSLSISVIENRARHFAIDTRFKFVSVVAQLGSGLRKPLELSVADRQGRLPTRPVLIPRVDLYRIRPDLTIPEVRTAAEWDLFSRLAINAVRVGDPDGPWQPTYRREVDMTTNRSSFVRASGRDVIPVLEGRHVAQYRWRAKSYVSGEGRAAIWAPERIQVALQRTQWFIPQSALTSTIRDLTKRSRIGFCDITGQTNERSFLAARIPQGVVCGNKVPTMQFPEGGRDREDLFLALANSFAVDWVLRRLITTTLNFFLLDSLLFPLMTEESAVGRQIIRLAREVTAAEGDPGCDLWQVGIKRARIDALVAHAWGINFPELELILADFPLLDRGQPQIFGEQRSSVTRDSVLAELARLEDANHESVKRLNEAERVGAVPYVPAEYV